MAVAVAQVEVQVKYAGYLQRQREEIEALVRARFSPDEELPGGEGDGQDD